MHYFALFDTRIGRCGIAWTTRGVSAVQLPDRGERETRARLTKRLRDACESTPPASIQRATDLLTAALRGEPVDFADVALDDERVPEFNRRVYELASAIPRGRTATYGEIARQLDAPELARDVGQALGRNPWPIIVPCHRVLAAGGKVGGFSAPGGEHTKLRLLALEGVFPNGQLALFDS